MPKLKRLLVSACFETAQRQRVIDRRAQVAVRFEESSVEVEADGGKGEVAHAGEGWRMVLQSASIWWHCR